MGGIKGIKPAVHNFNVFQTYSIREQLLLEVVAGNRVCHKICSSEVPVP